MSGEAHRAEPWFAVPAPVPEGPVAIIGAGIAGAALSKALADCGREVVVFDPAPAGGASGNPAGLIMPRLDADQGPVARFYLDAFLEALHLYSTLAEAFHPCGGVLAMDEKKIEVLRTLSLWPEGVLEFRGGSVLVPRAGVLRPGLAVEALLSSSTHVRANAHHWGADNSGRFWIETDSQRHEGFAALVLCLGAAHLGEQRDTVQASLGQIDVFEGPVPTQVRTDGSYIAPLGQALVAGATYAPHKDGSVQISEQNTDENRQAAEKLLGQKVGAHKEARAALRATTRDRHPIAGPLYRVPEATACYAGLGKGVRKDYPQAPYQPGLFVLTGLGSRGLVTAPLLARHLAALIQGEDGLPPDQAGVVHPGRFLIRAIKRGELNL